MKDVNWNKVGLICLLVFALWFIWMICSNDSSTNHHDGKCDICGKSATYQGSGEEYCNKHLKSAVEWYVKQGTKDD